MRFIASSVVTPALWDLFLVYVHGVARCRSPSVVVARGTFWKSFGARGARRVRLPPMRVDWESNYTLPTFQARPNGHCVLSR
jgi:hypothetical protein